MKHARFQSIPTAFLVLFGTLLAGCEAAQVPLGPPDELAVNTRVTGHWVSVSDDEEADEAVLKVWAFNDHEYYVEWEIEDDEDDLARIRTFASDLGDFLFANVQCINCTEEDRKEWYFYQFELTQDDELIIRSIQNLHYSQAMAEMTRSSDVRVYVQQHMHDEGFFSEEVGRFVRVNTSDED